MAIAASTMPERVFSDSMAARVIGFFFMTFGMFMAVLDIQVVSSSLPQIQAAIGAGADEISWVQTAYLVAEVVMVPLSAWLANLLSTRWLFVLSCAGFTAMSLACAFAWDTPSMILFRVLQGFVGGAMVPLAFSAGYKLFSPDRQPVALMVLGLTSTMAPALGPTIGGWVNENWSWQWLFLINVPTGLAAIVAVTLCVRVDRPNLGLLGRIDVPGIILVAACLGSLQIVLERGPREDWFDAGYIVFFTASAAISFVLLLWRELTTPHPVLDLRIFKDRNLSVGCIFSFVLGLMFYGQTYMLPVLLGTIRGFNSLQIGQTVGVTGVAMFVGAPLMMLLGRKIDHRILMGLGFFVWSFGFWINGFMTPAVGFAELFVPQFVRGLFLMFAAVPNTQLSLDTLPEELIGQGSAMYNVSRNVGGAVGIALISQTFNNQVNRNYALLREHLTPDQPGVGAYLTALRDTYGARLGDHTAAAVAALKQIDAMVLQQAAIMGWNDTFQIVAVGSCVPLILLPLLRKPQNRQVAMH